MKRVVVIGATGVFGSRLAGLLCDTPGLELVLAARGRPALEALKASLEVRGAKAPISIEAFDRGEIERLVFLRPWLVIDAAGPFQGADYGVALAAVRSGAHYIDLSDGRDFVAGFPAALHAAAASAGVIAVTGASSTPALSHAALDEMAGDWRRIDRITVAIAPGGRGPRGLSVVRAVLGYAGKPVRVFLGGRWARVAGWSHLRRLGMPGVGVRWSSICETPDLDLLPARFAVEDEALFRASLDPPPLHFGLVGLAWLVRLGLVRSLEPAATALRALAGLLTPLGSDRAGMIVEAGGADRDGETIRARWALWARANAGPNTPAAPAAALTRRLLDGRERRTGAFACTGLLSLPEIMAELRALPIWRRRQESHPDSPVLFRRLLGRRFDELPASVRAVHGLDAAAVFTGTAITRAGRGAPAALIRWALGLPRSGRSDVEVRLVPDARGEVWRRRFGAARFSSRLFDTGRLGVFEEQFGPLSFRFDLQPAPRGVVWEMIGWRVLGVPMPMWLAPSVRAAAEGARGRYRFRVVVAHRWAGLLFAYRGVLAP